MINQELSPNDLHKDHKKGKVISIYGHHEILLNISSLFLNDDLEQIETSACISFELINQLVNVERIQVHVYNYDTNCSNLFNQYYTSEEFKIDLPPIPFGVIDEMVSVLNNGYHIFIPNVKEMQNGIVKDALILQNTESILVIPMRIRDENIGFITMETISRRQSAYGEETISILKIYANMLANLITRGKDREQLKNLVEKISIQNKRHADFSFITSHNVRSSVANLMALTDFIKDDISNDSYNMLRTTVDRLNGNIFNINEILNGEREGYLRKIACNIHKAVDRVLYACQHSIEDQMIKVHNLVEDSLAIDAYPGYVDSILRQLIFNSIKFSKDDGEKRIAITSKELENNILITVADNGKGFDSENNRHKLFEVGARFHQEHSEGNGMGLFMARLHVESLGGTIEISSIVGVGTTVFIYLPK